MDLIGLTWQKASKSGGTGDCVEVTTVENPSPEWVAKFAAHKPGYEKYYLMRDSKLGDASPVLVFYPDEWTAFRAGMGLGEFDNL